MSAKKNATFKKSQTGEELSAMGALREIIAYVTKPTGASTSRVKRALRLVGAPGVAKSATVGFVCKMLEVKYVVFAAAEMHVEDINMPFPVMGTAEDGTRYIKALKQVIYESLRNAQVIIIEELARANPMVQQAFMELIATFSLNGEEMANLQGIIVCDNDASMDPDGGFIKELDAAMTNRCNTIIITDVDKNGVHQTNWARFLANEFPEFDLGPVIKARAGLIPEVRRKLSPRTLEHGLWAVQNGMPFHWALPIVNGRRQLLVDANGTDHTATIAALVAETFGLPADPNGPEGPEKLVKVAELLIRHGKNGRIIGAPGISKTQSVKEAVKAANFNEVYMSGSFVSPDNLFVPYVNGNGTVDLMLDERFVQEDEYVLILDEFSRCKPEVKPKFYGILQERRLAGKELPNLRAVIAMDNPSEVAGRKMDAGKIERAAADRFWVTIEIGVTETGSLAWLVETYGEVGALVVEWWKTVLSEEARAHIPPRTLHALIERHLDGLPLINALDYSRGEFIGEPYVYQLEALFDKRAVPRLSVVVANIDAYEAELIADQGSPLHTEVKTALAQAELPSLLANEEVIIRLLRHGVLTRDKLVGLLNVTGAGAATQSFWLRMITTARGPGASTPS